MALLGGARVVAADAILSPGWIDVRGDRIFAVGSGSAPGPVDVDLAGTTVVPGFVDMHVHGGGGGSFTSADVDLDGAAVTAALHRSHGTTTMMASLVTAPLDALRRAVAGLSELVDDGLLAGVHLEGPWLSPGHRGAHDPALLRDPVPAEVAGLLSSGRVRMVTLAPELPGGLAAVRQCVDAGVIAAVGHTDATYATTLDALAAGASVGTHLFNAMPPLHHRKPGPVVALSESPQTTVELIADGVHVHPAVLRLVVRAVGPDRVALVTDAMAATGAGDGDYRLGSLAVRVDGGVARLVEGGAIAGSTLTMDSAFRYVVTHCDVSLGDAARMTAGTPARTLGLADRGVVAAGLRADLVVLDKDLRVKSVMTAGHWVTAGSVTGPGAR